MHPTGPRPHPRPGRRPSRPPRSRGSTPRRGPCGVPGARVTDVRGRRRKPGGAPRRAHPGPHDRTGFPHHPRFAIRALHTASTVTVYQAYSPLIGAPAARDGRSPAAWKRDRMTWIVMPRSQPLSMTETTGTGGWTPYGGVLRGRRAAGAQRTKKHGFEWPGTPRRSTAGSRT
ncbi:DUF4291 family protein [Streptomyces sp. LN785]|uniref:DUF4291 family protein n=1 Tax=Streptomyces sp. LN785 TaxID=3112983 RepID=UPI00371895F9